MESKKVVLGLVGSPNRAGKTYELVAAALEGAAKAGAATELIQMADHVAAGCRDCLPWVCLKNQKCTYADDAFEFLSGEGPWLRRPCPGGRRSTGGTPVPWSNSSS